MPELPEVETVRRGLLPVMAGKRILSACAKRPDLRFALPARFAERLTGTRIEALDRRGKYLLARLGSGETWLSHLGMSGRFTIRPAGQGAEGLADFVHKTGGDPKHDHVSLEMEGGARVVFNDPRRFGYMTLFPTADEESDIYLRNLGVEPLSNALSGAYLLEAFAGRRAPLKAALLDQRIIAGLGNIYVCEALFRAGLSPRRRAGSLGPGRAARLAAAIQSVLAEAIEAGGSSLRDYAQADGALGYFQHRFAVYGRAGEPCLTPGCGGTVQRLVQSGRSTFYCGLCQR